MKWRQIGCAILFSPILIGCFVFIAVLVVVKLPMIFCQWRRAVRWLPYIGLAYYGLLALLVPIAFDFVWWEVLVGTLVVTLAGNWLLPDPISFAFNPRKRRAVKLAIEHVESGEGPSAIYMMVGAIGSEDTRTIVSIGLNSHTMPPNRRFFAVDNDTPKIEELDFEYVSLKHGVQGMF